MKIESRRMHVFSAMRKSHCQVGLVRTLIGRKPRVAVNAEQRSTRRPRVGNKIRTDLVQRSREVADELDRRLMRARLVLVLMFQEPLAIVVALESREKSK